MSDAERTEAATPRRRQKETEKGNISKSQDMISASVLSCGVALLFVMLPGIVEKLKNLLYYTFTHLNPNNIDASNFVALLSPFAKIFGEAVFPFALYLFLLIVVIVRIQVGSHFVMNKIKPKFDKISPKSMLENLRKKINPFEMKNLVEFLKSILKMAIVFLCGFTVYNARKDELFGLLGVSAATGLGVVGSILAQMVINICVALIIVGFIDKKYQDYEFEKSIKMSKQEIKDEYKNLEGDPIIKSKIRSAQMQFAQRRMMEAIPTADVVVTNPTHYAIAIKYDKSVSAAPMVVAKGVDYLAFKIRDAAQSSGVPIVENKTLARALYKLVPIDGIIPAELYVAVAEILAWVYNKNRSEAKI